MTDYYDQSYPPSILTPPDPPDPPPEQEPVTLPGTSWTKATIVDWLVESGVDLDDDALDQLTKAELLELVDDLLDDETDS